MARNYLSAAFILFAAVLSPLQAAQYNCDRTLQGGYFGGGVIALNDSGGALYLALERSPYGSYTSWHLAYPDGHDVGQASLTGAADINNLGQVVGSYVDESGVRVNYLRNASGTSTTPITAPAGAENEPFAVSGINDEGYISGVIGQGAQTRVFVRSPSGEFKFYSIPNALERVHINNAQQLTVTQTQADQSARSFILNADGTRQAIDFPGLTSTQLFGINELGDVTGTAQYGASAFEGVGFVRKASGEFIPALCATSVGTVAADINNHRDLITNAARYLGAAGTILTPTDTPPDAALHLTFTDWQFAMHSVGDSSGPGKIYVTNTGSEGRFLSLSYFDQRGDPDFAVQSDCDYLAPGATCTLTFTFTPTAAGGRKSTYYLISDDGQPIRTITLRGTGDGQSLQLSRTDWTFASHPVGVKSGPGTIYIYNNGTRPVTFTDVAFEGGAAEDFLLENGCPAELRPYTTCKITFYITPQAQGLRSASLSIRGSAPGLPQSISVKGYGQ